jgi:hypothetical protein
VYFLGYNFKINNFTKKKTLNIILKLCSWLALLAFMILTHDPGPCFNNMMVPSFVKQTSGKRDRP